MITGEYDKLVEIARYNVCAVHKTSLEVAWAKKQWVLACGGDGGHYPDAVTRQLSLTEEHKVGEELPEPIKSNVIKGMRRRTMQQGKQSKQTSLSLVPKVDLGTGELLVPELVQALVDYAHKYHLDPERGHVVLMYGKPYVTIDGYLYDANRKKIAYSLTGRLLNAKERTTLLLEEGDLGWRAEVTLLDKNQTFIGLGLVTKEEREAEVAGKPEVKRYPVIAAKPQNMVQKRAEWQALRRAFPIGGE